MAVYYCEECDSYKDGDYDVCGEHPTDDCATICEECADNLKYLAEEEARERAAYNAATPLEKKRVIASKDNPYVSYVEDVCTQKKT